LGVKRCPTGAHASPLDRLEYLQQPKKRLESRSKTARWGMTGDYVVKASTSTTSDSDDAPLPKPASFRKKFSDIYKKLQVKLKSLKGLGE
jgi:hypothetical protein